MWGWCFDFVTTIKDIMDHLADNRNLFQLLYLLQTIKVINLEIFLLLWFFIGGLNILRNSKWGIRKNLDRQIPIKLFLLLLLWINLIKVVYQLKNDLNRFPTTTTIKWAMGSNGGNSLICEEGPQLSSSLLLLLSMVKAENQMWSGPLIEEELNKLQKSRRRRGSPHLKLIPMMIPWQRS